MDAELDPALFDFPDEYDTADRGQRGGMKRKITDRRGREEEDSADEDVDTDNDLSPDDFASSESGSVSADSDFSSHSGSDLEDEDDQDNGRSGDEADSVRRGAGPRGGAAPGPGPSTMAARRVAAAGRQRGTGGVDNEADEAEDAGGEEGSFDDLINSISTSETTDLHRLDALSRSHDKSIVDEMEAIREDLALAKGFGRRKHGKRGGRRERRLPPEIADRLGEANAHYAMGENDLAVPILKDIIRMDATVWEAWVTLAQCHADDGRADKSLGCLLVAAHLRQDKQNWKELGDKSRAAGQIDQALYCYKRAVSMGPNDFNLLYDYATLLRSKDKHVEALDIYRRLLKLSPHNVFLLSETPLLFVQTESIDEGIRYFQNALDFHLETFASPDAPDLRHVANALSVDFLTSLADFFFTIHDYEGMIPVLKRGQRWFQGRISETFWDEMPDDREFDPPGTQREGLPNIGVNDDGYDMEVNLRHRLAIARLKLGNDEDASIHIDEICRQDPQIYSPLWADIGVALMDRGQYERAAEIFTRLCNELPQADVVFVSNLGLCHLHLRDTEAAIHAFESVLRETPDDRDIKLRLAEALEADGQFERALSLVQEAMETSDGPERVADDQAQDEMFFNAPVKPRNPRADRDARRAARLEREKAEEQLAQEELAICNEAEVQALQGDEAAVRRYMSASGRMITRFRTAKSLYPIDRSRKYYDPTKRNTRILDFVEQASAMANRLEQEADDAEGNSEAQVTRLVERQRIYFAGIHADTWLRIVVVHACLLMRTGDDLAAQDLVQHVAYSNMFLTLQYDLPIQLALLSAAIRLRDFDEVLKILRHLMRNTQFHHEPFRLLSAALGSGMRAIDTFGNLNLQKYLLREIRLWDMAVDGRPINWNDKLARWIAPYSSGKERDTKSFTPSTRKDPPRRATASVGREEEEEEDEGEEEEGGGDDDEEEEEEDGVGHQQDECQVEKIYIRHEAWPKPTKRSPFAYAVYGQVMLASKSFQSAIYYLLKAFEANPYDPVICLNLAQGYLGRSLNRQTDNRIQQIVTGMAFLNRYRKLANSVKGSREMEEVEYNFARAFHGVGIFREAVPLYDKVLSSVRNRMNDSTDPMAVLDQSLARETAYNLSSIYFLTGGLSLAQEIINEWLSY